MSPNSTFKPNATLLLVLALLVYIIFSTNGIKTDIKKYEDKIEQVQIKIDSAQSVNTVIDKKIDSVTEKVVTVNKEIQHIDKTITIVKQQTHEKVNNVSKFSNPELEYFFTNRYNPTFSNNKN